MRVTSARDLGLAVRQARMDHGMTQAQLAAAAAVSRRWLSDLEAGKASAAIGLVLRTLAALNIGLDTFPIKPSDEIDLDALLGGGKASHA